MKRAATFALGSALALAGCGPSGPGTDKKLVVLGFDGMDPEFVRRHQEKLPNLMRLAETGGFTNLDTVMPPQSPVAWSTVITGMTPAGHGIFDFVHRKPDTIAPFSSMAEAVEGEWSLNIGPYVIPLDGGDTIPLRKGRAFWEYLADEGISATMMKMPTDFPPLSAARGAVSGMGTPDMLGSFGTFQFFTEDPDEFVAPEVSGGEVRRLRFSQARAVAELHGPVNSFVESSPRTIANIYIDIDDETETARIEIGDQSVVLAEGDWSDWIRVEFELIPYLKSATGIVRLFLKEAHPQVKLYVSPINIDPGAPEVPISHPPEFAAELAQVVGPFYTQGMAEETKALSAHLISRDDFVEQAKLVYHEEIALYDHLLAEYDGGFFFHYFSAIDQSAHMLWGDYEHLLVPFYEEADAVVGRTMESLSDDTTLMVISDHGFQRFDREVNLNTYLMEEGFLTLDDPENTGPIPGFKHVDWSKTEAYAMGLNGLYINRKGREKNGIVGEEDIEDLKERLEVSLLEMTDPGDGEKIIEILYDTEELYSTKDLTYAPDFLVGFTPPYRMSPETGLGAVPSIAVEDNDDEWIGDHCMAHETVPGVLFSNREITIEDPSLHDVPVTILSAFGLPIPETMQGRNVIATK